MNIEKKLRNDARETIKDATIKLLREYGIVTEADFQNLDEEEGAVVYENLKAGIMEEYDMDWDELDELLAEIFDEK